MRPDIHHLTGAYVADALPPQEELLFERHLEECSLCAAEVRELRETTARLALAAAQQPPPALRQQVLAEIGSVRQQPPPVLSLPGQRRARATWLVRVAAVVVALAIIAALGTVILRQQDRIDRLQASNTEVTEVISAPDAQTAVAKTGGASGLVVYSRERNAAVFSSSGLADLPSDRIYQLWAIGPSGDVGGLARLLQWPDRAGGRPVARGCAVPGGDCRTRGWVSRSDVRSRPRRSAPRMTRPGAYLDPARHQGTFSRTEGERARGSLPPSL